MIGKAAVVVDASVCLKWFVPEAGTREALSVLRSNTILHAPDILVSEVANALWKKIGRDLISEADAGEALRMLLADKSVRLAGIADLARPALHAAVALAHPVYDCLYLAQAGTLGVPLITADRHLHAAVRGTHWESVVQLLPITP